MMTKTQKMTVIILHFLALFWVIFFNIIYINGIIGESKYIIPKILSEIFNSNLEI